MPLLDSFSYLFYRHTMTSCLSVEDVNGTSETCKQVANVTDILDLRLSDNGYLAVAIFLTILGEFSVLQP